ncbi:MAG: RICIN domain-containing protein [Coriobacteriales bacterium]|jgi:beta-N-acetylglucosaminidase|nr:RICIN domain-containing protein [Coriobacteriales bacterium]
MKDSKINKARYYTSILATVRLLSTFTLAAILTFAMLPLAAFANEADFALKVAQNANEYSQANGATMVQPAVAISANNVTTSEDDTNTTAGTTTNTNNDTFAGSTGNPANNPENKPAENSGSNTTANSENETTATSGGNSGATTATPSGNPDATLAGAGDLVTETSGQSDLEASGNATTDINGEHEQDASSDANASGDDEDFQALSLPWLDNKVVNISSALMEQGKLRVDVPGQSAAQGTALTVYESNVSPAQRFRFVPAASGYYTIECVCSGLVLDIYGSQAGSGAKIIQWPRRGANGGDNQMWRVVESGAGSYYLVSKLNPAFCLDVSGQLTANGTAIVLWNKGDNQLNQRFFIDPIAPADFLPDVAYVVSSLASGKLLDIRAGSVNDGAEALIWPANGGINQRFFFEYDVLTGYYNIISANSGKALDVNRASLAAGEHVIQWPRHNGYNQKWAVTKNPKNGTYSIQSAQSSLSIDVNGGSTSDGAQIITWGWHGQSNQQWVIRKPYLPDGNYGFSSFLNVYKVFDVKAESKENGADLLLWEKRGGANQAFAVKNNADGTASLIAAHSNKALDVKAGILGNGSSVIQYDVQKDNVNQKWFIEYEDTGTGSSRVRIISALDSGYCMTLAGLAAENDVRIELQPIAPAGTTQGDAQLFVPFVPDSKSTIIYEQVGCSLSQMATWQLDSPYVSCSLNDMKTYLDPNKNSSTFYQFMDLRFSTGLTGANLDTYITSTSKGKSGVFVGMGQVFVDAAKQYGINEAYFISHAIGETGWGTSELARGYYYDGTTLVQGKLYPAGTYYNFWGIGAYDDDPIVGGRALAIVSGWSSKELAIYGAARWIANNYIYASNYPQPTIYAMRWDYNHSVAIGGRGWHQYATAVDWPRLAARLIAECYDAVGGKDFNVRYLVPVYR